MDSLLVLLKALVVILLGIAAWMDYRTRTVSNWVTLPIFFGSLILFPFMSLDIGARVISVFFAMLFFSLWRMRAMGGADTKILIALTLVWLPAAMLSMLSMAIFGIVVRLKNKKKLPALIPVFIAATLTFSLELSIMLSN